MRPTARGYLLAPFAFHRPTENTSMALGQFACANHTHRFLGRDPLAGRPFAVAAAIFVWA